MVETPHSESPLYGWEQHEVSHHSVKFDGHRHSDIGNLEIYVRLSSMRLLQLTWRKKYADFIN